MKKTVELLVNDYIEDVLVMKKYNSDELFMEAETLESTGGYLNMDLFGYSADELRAEAIRKSNSHTHLSDINIINISDEQIESLWKEFGNIPLDEDEEGRLVLAEDWRNFKKGTWLDDVWTWFDEIHSKGIGWLYENIK